MPTENQKILAKMVAVHAIDLARRGPQQSPQELLVSAVEEAIVDARQRRDDLGSQGAAGSQSYLAINAQIARWEAARRQNR